LSRFEFESVLRKRRFADRDLSEIVLNGKADANEFIVNMSSELRAFFASPRISDTFRCLTGISTGNDASYLSPLKSGNFSVPFYKNPASKRFFALPNSYLVQDFLEIAKTNKNFMIRNREYLYREGITCSSMGVAFGACRLPPGATYGVNASIFTDDVQDQWRLLAYLNSYLVTYFVRGVLNRSNMITSGYVSRIPVPKMSASTISALGDIARSAVADKVGSQEAQQYVTRINTLLAKELGLSDDAQRFLSTFAQTVVRAA